MSEKCEAASIFCRHNTVRTFFKNAARSLTLSDGFNTLLILALMSDFCFLS
ncbi:hypothetical protein IBT54_001727 [Pantoea sp. S62]|nr:hypothetical protein [Pantoea sp. S62]